MKRLIFILLVFIAAGCTPHEAADGPIVKSESGAAFRVVKIDGCDYLVYENCAPGCNSYSFAITHKGNCKNH